MKFEDLELELTGMSSPTSPPRQKQDSVKFENEPANMSSPTSTSFNDSASFDRGGDKDLELFSVVCGKTTSTATTATKAFGEKAEKKGMNGHVCLFNFSVQNCFDVEG